MPGDRLSVKIAPEVWVQEVGRLRAGSPERIAAERERTRLERDGISIDAVARCKPASKDGTRLPGLFKLYVPINHQPASRRPFGFVLSPARDGGRTQLEMVAFGTRHPSRGTRSVYERAHKRLHGRYPNQERSAPAQRDRSLALSPPSRGLTPSPDRGGFSR